MGTVRTRRERQCVINGHVNVSYMKILINLVLSSCDPYAIEYKFFICNSSYLFCPIVRELAVNAKDLIVMWIMLFM